MTSLKKQLIKLNLQKDEAEKHRGNVIMTFNNLLKFSHKILFNTWARNSQ